jgi:hypothetical protein
MLKFKNVKPSDKAIKILSWDKVCFTDGKEEKFPVRKIVLTIEAGNIAQLEVERYLSSKEDELIVDAISKSYTELPTFVNYYYLEDVSKDIEISVSGPRKFKKRKKRKIN